MILEKDGSMYVWMAAYVEEKGDCVHNCIFCDESIDKKYRTKLFSLFLKENDSVLLLNENKTLFCIFDVTGKKNQPDWDDARIVAFTYLDGRYTIDVKFGSEFDYLEEEFRSERLFFSSLLQCATEFSSRYFSLDTYMQDKFQTYWNCLAQNIPYIPRGTSITDMDITTIASRELNVCIYVKLNDVWSYCVPYTQILLENIISEKIHNM